MHRPVSCAVVVHAGILIVIRYVENIGLAVAGSAGPVLPALLGENYCLTAPGILIREQLFPKIGCHTRIVGNTGVLSKWPSL